MFKTLKLKIDNLKRNKNIIKLCKLLKDFAIEYKFISPKKEKISITERLDNFSKKYSKNSKVRTCKFSFVEIILIYFISIFGVLFTMPWILFFLLLGPIGFIFLFIGHLTVFFSLIYAE